MIKYIAQIFTLIIPIIVFITQLFNIDSINLGFVVIVLAIVLLLNLYLSGYRRPDKRDFIYKEILVIGLCFLLQCIFYISASNSSYITNFNSIFKGNISVFTLFIIMSIVLLREILRYIVMNTKTNKRYKKIVLNIIMIVLCIIIDFIIDPNGYTSKNFLSIYEFVVMVLLVNTTKNIFLNYLSKDNGFIITLSYILVMDLYIYFLPIIPEINLLLKAVILLVFPYFVYYCYKAFLERRKIIKKSNEKKGNKVLNMITIIVFTILVCLVSREFKYSMIGIGSKSMTGTIDKGDAIIYRKYEGNENLKNKIIVFKKNNVLIVHRVIKTYVLDEARAYKTKGDNNEKVDEWLVSDNEVVGIVEKRIRFIAWPSVWLSEIF